MSERNRSQLATGAILIVLGVGLFALQFSEGSNESVILFLIGGLFVVGYLYSRAYVTHTARRGDDALSLLDTHRIQALLVKPDLPDHDVNWFYSRVSARHPHLIDRLVFVVDHDLSEDTKAFVEETGCPTVPSSAGGAELDGILSSHGHP